jgi:dUTP pyrophosphatase
MTNDTNVQSRVIVKILNMSDNPNPKYETSGSVGMDIMASETYIIPAGKTQVVDTGLKVEIPEGYEIQVRPRSGLSAKTSMRVANSPGTIDSDYRGFLGVIMWNSGTEPYVVGIGDRIAQIVLCESPKIQWEEIDSVDDFSSTVRGSGGFGHTGK